MILAKKAKNKAIIGIAVAMIMVASVFAAMMPAGLARSPEEKNVNQGDEGYIDLAALAGDSVKVLRGQTLNFSVCDKTIYGYSEDAYGKVRGTTSDDYDTAAEFSTADAEYAWFVDVVPGDAATHASGYNSAVDVILSLEIPHLDIEIEDEAGKSIEYTAIGRNITLALSTNLFSDDLVVVKERDPWGHILTPPNRRTISDAEGYSINTGRWYPGEYDIWLETADVGDYARGLDIPSNKVTIIVAKEEITIVAETTEPSLAEKVLFTVRAPPYQLFNFSTAHPEDVVMTSYEDNPLGLPVGEEVPMDNETYIVEVYGEEGKFNAITDEDGEVKFVVYFTDDRTYTFRVWYDATTYADAEAKKRDDSDIDVETGVTIDVPRRTVVVGEDATITVTASGGDDVDIVIDDILECNDNSLVDGATEIKWNTAGKKAGSYFIEVFTNCVELTSADVGKDVRDKINAEELDADAKESVRLILPPNLTARLSRHTVQPGDSFNINGTAAGTFHVELVMISPKGGNGTGMDGLYGVTIYTIPAFYECSSCHTEINKKGGVSAQEGNENQGEKGYINVATNAGSAVKVLRGETLNFSMVDRLIYGYSEGVYGKVRGTTSADYDTAAEFSEADAEYAWFVDVVPGDAQTHDSGYNSAVDVILSLERPILEVEIEDECGKSRESIYVGGKIVLDLRTNLFADDQVVIKKRNPDGHVFTLFERGTISEADGYSVSTDGWYLGVHDIWVETADGGDYARGLDIKSNVDTITVLKEEITIEAETTEPSIVEQVLFTVKAPYYKLFNFKATHPEDVEMTDLENDPWHTIHHEEVAYDPVKGTFTGRTDEDGEYKFVTRFIEDRTYTFTVESDMDFDGVISTDEKDDIDIAVGKIAVTFDVPPTEIIGDDMVIQITASAGDYVDVVIDDILESNDEALIDGVAGVKWATEGKTEGTHIIEVFVNCDMLTFAMVGTDVEDEIEDYDLDVDGTVTIRLIEPGLTAEQPKDDVARGGFHVIKGRATGVNEVDIAIIGPDGLTENRLGIEYGFELTTSSVSENEFEAEIYIPKEVDAGAYTTLVLIPGRDGEYDATNAEDGELRDALEACGYEVPEDLVGKTREQLMAIIGDASFDVAGSDDLYAMVTFSVTEALNSFCKTINVDCEADTGNYTVLVLSPGIDGVFGDSYYSYMDSILDLDGAGPEPGAIDVSDKTQEDIISIIKNATIDQTGSDDLILRENIVITQLGIFDTGESTYPYPSISGTHNGTITPYQDISVSTLYTYACPGTGGHTEYAAFYNAATGEAIANGRWNGYQGDYRYIEFDAPFTLHAKVTYNYTLKTGSYPQIIHAESKIVTCGVINCTEFTDVNGRRYSNWIPAIRLE